MKWSQTSTNILIASHHHPAIIILPEFYSRLVVAFCKHVNVYVEVVAIECRHH